MRDLKVNQPYRLVGTVFGASVDSNFWTVATSGAGSASGVATALATVTSGTANSGYGKITSVRSARFLFAHPLLFRGAFRLTALTKAGTTRAWGAVSLSTVTPQNGVYFSVNESDVLSVNYVSGGSVTSIASSSFNVVPNYTMDTNVHAYEIVYFTMGIWFYIDNVLVHKVTPETSVLFQTLDTPINFWSTNSAGGTTSASLECWNAVIISLGRELTSLTSKYQAGTTAGVNYKTGSGVVHGLVISAVSNNATITLYDNTAASGTILFASGAMAANTDPFLLGFDEGLPFTTGLTLVISAANCTVTTIYE
jgi:hypothetical protein